MDALALEFEREDRIEELDGLFEGQENSLISKSKKDHEIHELNEESPDDQQIEALNSSEGEANRVNLLASIQSPARVWRLDPLQCIDHWKRLRMAVDETVLKKEPILIVATNPQRSDLAKGIRFPRMRANPTSPQVTLLTTNWIYGRLTNFDQFREMAMKYQITPSYEMKHTSHHRYSTYIRPLEPRRIHGKRPGLVIYLNAGDHLVAVREAYHMGIPTAGIVNTNFPSPERLHYLLPGNDRGLRAQLRYLTLRSNQLKRSRDRHSS